jgi:hypothetical protein
MSKLFTYHSKIEIPFLKLSPDDVEKFVENLRKWLSDKSGEIPDRTGNNNYFAINPTITSIFMFQGIDSGEVKVMQQQGRLVIEYRLSFLFPMLAIFILDLFFLALFYSDLKIDIPIRDLLIVTTIVLFLNAGSTILFINDFPNDIVEIWNETKKIT